MAAEDHSVDLAVAAAVVVVSAVVEVCRVAGVLQADGK
jgi:hypothetical protein